MKKKTNSKKFLELVNASIKMHTRKKYAHTGARDSEIDKSIETYVTKFLEEEKEEDED